MRSRNERLSLRLCGMCFDSHSRGMLLLGVTIVVESTKTEKTATDASAFDILREVVKYVTPATPINF